MDCITQLIEGAAQIIAKVLLNKEAPHECVVEQPMSDGSLDALLSGLIAEGRYNEAENILFDELEKFPSIETYNTGLDFFRRLDAVDDAALQKGNYTRDEITQGLEDLQALLVTQFSL